MADAPALVTGEWVKRSFLAEGKALKVLDCSWFLVPPSSPHRPALAGAAYFDVDEVADKSEDKSPSPHMLPSPQVFAAWMDRHGIANDDHVVLYDHSNGLLTASARVWWTFKVFGHTRVSVLEGGYAKWPIGVEIPEASRIISPSSSSEVPATAPSYRATYHPELVWSKEDVLRHIVSKHEGEPCEYVLVDARPSGRFLGQAPEPRTGVPSGSVPGSVSLPFTDLFSPEEGVSAPGQAQPAQLLKGRDQLAALFAQRGIRVDMDPQHQQQDEASSSSSSAGGARTRQQVVAAMCGSGVTACPLALVLAHTFGRTNVPVYDGSWTEWALSPQLPKQHVLQPAEPPLHKYHH